jgi:uncharacterized membrane protein YdfJ with MMPL/SSD domain
MGGPPSDNVAIDEEGTSTLLRLASLSGLIGIILAYYSFRSIRITIMLFFIGGVSAISSLSYVWYFGSRLDAILMTMPSLIYVLSMSGAVHIVNYYKDACEEYGHKRAVDIAIHHGWFPCVLAAFTTALGLFSLCTSNLTPIYKFGFFSAIATIATLFFLFTYLPAALTVWPPPYRRIDKSDATHDADANSAVLRFWNRVFAITTYKPTLVLVVGLLLMVVFSYGLTKIQTTVQLLKLFDPDAKVLKDYEWMEENLGKLVPAEIVINVDERVQQEVKNTARLPNKSSDEELLAAGGTATATPDRDQASETTPPAISQTDTPADGTSFDADKALKYTLLERMEISYRIRRQLERFFGPDGSDIVGAGMSTDVFVPIQIVDTQLDTNSNIGIRRIFNTRLLQQRDAMADQDYLAISDAKTLHPDADTIYSNSPHYDKREMWRISLRL